MVFFYRLSELVLKNISDFMYEMMVVFENLAKNRERDLPDSDVSFLQSH